MNFRKIVSRASHEEKSFTVLNPLKLRRLYHMRAYKIPSILIRSHSKVNVGLFENAVVIKENHLLLEEERSEELTSH
jgi:hypothetical protein